MSAPWFSVVIPVYNEKNVIPELVNRCVKSLCSTGKTFEIVFVDDGSTDGTYELLVRYSTGARIQIERLAQNHGQFQATLAGLRAAKGRWIAVLDGDLQDPPEVIKDLIYAIDRSPENISVVFAVKTSRREALWFRFLRSLYGFLLFAGGVKIPASAGSYCLLRREVAQRIANLRIRHCNLAAAVAWTRPDWCMVPYNKEARYDHNSRVGLFGLLRESIGSLLISGALFRLGAVTSGAIILISTLILMDFISGNTWLGISGIVIGALLITGILIIKSRISDKDF